MARWPFNAINNVCSNFIQKEKSSKADMICSISALSQQWCMRALATSDLSRRCTRMLLFLMPLYMYDAVPLFVMLVLHCMLDTCLLWPTCSIRSRIRAVCLWLFSCGSQAPLECMKAVFTSRSVCLCYFAFHIPVLASLLVMFLFLVRFLMDLLEHRVRVCHLYRWFD